MILSHIVPFVFRDPEKNWKITMKPQFPSVVEAFTALVCKPATILAETSLHRSLHTGTLLRNGYNTVTFQGVFQIFIRAAGACSVTWSKSNKDFFQLIFQKSFRIAILYGNSMWCFWINSTLKFHHRLLAKVTVMSVRRKRINSKHFSFKHNYSRERFIFPSLHSMFQKQPMNAFKCYY